MQDQTVARPYFIAICYVWLYTLTNYNLLQSTDLVLFKET